MLDVALFGAGRIGAIHAENVARHGGARLRYVVDVSAEARGRLASRFGAEDLPTGERALADRAVGAVLIASPTDTHVELIVAAARAGKAIFCEKPIDLDLARVDRAIAEVERAGVPFFIAFNRRFDPSFQRLQRELQADAIGRLETLTIVSRDPSPPPAGYVRVSGGLFRDMMIHDLDMARWLLREEPVEVFASASNLVEPYIGALGDVDTAMVLLRTASGTLCHIQNSRRAVYGYDQRIEAFGARGMLTAGNWRESTVERWGEDGVQGDRPLRFFLERYAEAYRCELAHFVEMVEAKTPGALLTGAEDGRRALVLAEAALESLATRRPVSLSGGAQPLEPAGSGQG